MEAAVVIFLFLFVSIGLPVIHHLMAERSARRRWGYAFDMQDLEWQRKREQHRMEMVRKYPGIYGE